MAAPGELDEAVRSAAFAFLRTVQLRTGGPVRYDDVKGFEFDGRPMPLMGGQHGICKPKLLDAALSFRTVYTPNPHQRPYTDDMGADGYQRYKWRGDDGDHPENVAMRTALRRQLPLIWFVGITSGVYLPVFPVWLVDEEPAHQQFVAALDDVQRRDWGPAPSAQVADLQRAYGLRLARERLHQPVFRERVLVAYEETCALCRLRRRELLDAAHIRSDAAGGEPVVTNGIAMCKIHHAAFDTYLMAVRPDYVVEVRRDLLAERDGPTLRHALQGLHGTEILLPRSRKAHPDPVLLEERYEEFRRAG